MEKDFLAGQGERKRITPIQFCSNSTLPATPGPSHPHPAKGLGPGPGPSSSGCSSGAACTLEMLETGGHGAPAALVGFGSFSPIDPWGSWPAMAERNAKTGLEVIEVLSGFGVSWVSRCYLHPSAFSLAQNPLSSLSRVYTFTPRSFCLSAQNFTPMNRGC